MKIGQNSKRKKRGKGEAALDRGTEFKKSKICLENSKHNTHWAVSPVKLRISLSRQDTEGKGTNDKGVSVE